MTAIYWNKSEHPRSCSSWGVLAVLAADQAVWVGCCVMYHLVLTTCAGSKKALHKGKLENFVVHKTMEILKNDILLDSWNYVVR